MAKPDSTSPKGLMKGTEDSTFSEYADLIPSGQVPRTNRPGRRHIESVSSDGKPQESLAEPSEVQENNDDTWTEL